MTRIRGKLLTSVAGLVAIGFAAGPAVADGLLTGSIASAAGQKLEGVTVSAKKDGSTITTSVYSDQAGNYYFPPLPDGKYKVWAQALSFKTAKGEVDLGATKHQDFALAAITDPDEKIRQLPSEMLVDALPEDTVADANIKKTFTNNCTGCHSQGRSQHRRLSRRQRQGERRHRVQPQGTRGLSRPRPRPRRKLLEDQGPSAPERRGRPRGVDHLRPADQPGCRDRHPGRAVHERHQ
jgi:Carboxypeptidase regulatory-like domain